MAFFSFNSSNLVRSSKKILESCCKNNSVITTSVLYDPKHGNSLPHHKSFHSISERGTSNCIQYNDIPIRFNSSSSGNKSYKLLVVGGGAGGCSTAAKFASKLGKGSVGVIEPSEMHYYQPMWTLVGGDLKTLEQSGKPMGQVLPKNADWIKSSATKFDPEKCTVTTAEGDEISYEYLVIAVGLQLRYDQIKGFPDALETPSVWSNYHPKYVTKGPECLKSFKKGNAIFTFPKPPIKCPGAPQKIMYIAENHLKKNGKREQAKVIYHTALPVLFGVKKYADALWKVVEERGIEVNLNSALVEVNADKKEATFENLQSTEKVMTTTPYEILHMTPPMSAPECLRLNAPGLTDAAGFVEVDGKTLQHVRYKNVFSLGDCSSIPTSKTAAAVATELGILKKNLTDVMNGKDIEGNRKYDGYTSCPLVIGPGQCIMAEFDNSVPPQPLETFPINQGVPRWTMYNMKAHILPEMYWQMLKGRWEGPRIFRKIMHLGMSK